MPEVIPSNTMAPVATHTPGLRLGAMMRESKRVLPPVGVGSSMFPSIRQQQNLYWRNLINDAARESLLQRLVSYLINSHIANQLVY